MAQSPEVIENAMIVRGSCLREFQASDRSDFSESIP